MDWKFLYRALETLGFPAEFSAMVRLLLTDATGHINVNGKLSPSFPIQRGVRQGCPLAPYLFLVVAEVLNSMIKEQAKVGAIQGIHLPFDRQQILLQYADDTTLSLQREERSVKQPFLLLIPSATPQVYPLTGINQLPIG